MTRWHDSRAKEQTALVAILHITRYRRNTQARLYSALEKDFAG